MRNEQTGCVKRKHYTLISVGPVLLEVHQLFPEANLLPLTPRFGVWPCPSVAETLQGDQTCKLWTGGSAVYILAS